MKGSSENSLYVFGESWDGPVKIGVTGNVGARLEQFRSKLPFVPTVLFEAVHEDAFALEAHVHTTLSAHRMNGEWFDGAAFGPEGLDQAIETFTGRSKRRSEPDSYSQQVSIWVRELLAESQRRTGCTTEESMSIVSEETGLRRTFLWSQTYRPAVRVYAADYFAVKAAHDLLPRIED